jgi:integrase
VKRGKTPVLTAEEARALLGSITTDTLAGMRDRALIAVMVYSFARVSAALGMNVEDYFQQGKHWWFRLYEKGGKRHEVPAHHNAESYVDVYLQAARIADEPKGALFRTCDRQGQLTSTRMTRNDALRMVQRRARKAGLSASVCCHSFHATGITVYLHNQGSLEHAQAIAGHESPCTTKLYDRTSDQISLDEIEKILI